MILHYAIGQSVQFNIADKVTGQGVVVDYELDAFGDAEFLVYKVKVDGQLLALAKESGACRIADDCLIVGDFEISTPFVQSLQS